MSGARILIVDDDLAILRSLRRSLEAHGYQVRTLDAGAEVERVAPEDHVAVRVVLARVLEPRTEHRVALGGGGSGVRRDRDAQAHQLVLAVARDDAALGRGLEQRAHVLPPVARIAASRQPLLGSVEVVLP